MSPPIVKEICPAPTVEQAFANLSDRQGIVLFDSSLIRAPLGRYSFLAAEPVQVSTLERATFGVDPFAEIRSQLQEFNATTLAGLPPFQGGAAGILSYELGACFERLPTAPRDEFRIPVAVTGLYFWVIAWDHLQNRCWIIAHDLPADFHSFKKVTAQEQCRELESAILGTTSHDTQPVEETIQRSDRIGLNDEPIPLLPELRSNFSKDAYLEAVQRIVDYIHAGDIFQANLSQRLLFPATCSPAEQYLRLRKQNPAPFAGYFATEDWRVMSSSPERFLQLSNGEVSTRPIKGTRKRLTIPEADLYTRDELRESEKDRAENVMIVDLLRNDLSRVCQPGTIRVPELCTVEAYETVSHLVSEVRGSLRDGVTFWDVMAATFPGGSITGAPKIRAMQIITELEQIARGPYCGSLFYCGFDGTADSNLLIRTMTQRHGWIAFPAGGGIIAQSDPRSEYEETLHKARGLLNSLSPGKQR